MITLEACSTMRAPLNRVGHFKSMGYPFPVQKYAKGSSGHSSGPRWIVQQMIPHIRINDYTRRDHLHFCCPHITIAHPYTRLWALSIWIALYLMPACRNFGPPFPILGATAACEAAMPTRSWNTHFSCAW